MITYDKGWWGNRVLFRAYGSAFPRSMPYACLSAAIAATVSTTFDTAHWQLLRNSYPLQLFFFIVGFVIIFRNNLSYGRYWEGRSQLQQMTARLTDAVRMAIDFDRRALPHKGASEEEVEEHRWFCDTFVHLVSLFHGVALATLRGDFNMENLTDHDSGARAPGSNARSVKTAGKDAARMAAEEPQHGGAHDKDDHKALVQRRGGRFGAEARERIAHGWAGPRGVMDILVLRTSPHHAQHIHQAMKLPVIGSFTQSEGSALGAFTTSGSGTAEVPDLDVVIHGVTLDDGTYAPAPTERVQAIGSWILQCLNDRIEAGGVKMAAPFQMRIHAVLSDAFLAFEHCQKLVDTPFPFPWAQAVNIFLALFTLFAPFAVVAFTDNTLVATVLTFLAVATHVTLNEVASDIEDPFHYDPNELPLPQMQYKLNERLLAVRHADRPIAFTDVAELTGPGNTVSAPANASAAGQAGPGAAPRAGGADMFAALTQAAFAASVTDNPQSAGAAGARPTFLRAAASSRRSAQAAAGVQAFGAAFKSAQAAPAPPASRAGVGRTAPTAAGAAAAQQDNSHDTLTPPRARPHSAQASGSPLAPVDETSGIMLGMPPAPGAEAFGSRGAGGQAPQAAPRGWALLRAGLKTAVSAQQEIDGRTAAFVMPPDPPAAVGSGQGSITLRLGVGPPGNKQADSRDAGQGAAPARVHHDGASDSVAEGPQAHRPAAENAPSPAHAAARVWRAKALAHRT